MSGRLPVFVNPLIYARRGMRVSGTLSLANMARLRERLLEPLADVEVEMAFGSEGKRCFVEGTVKGTIYIECQRCMNAMPMKIDHTFKLGLIESEAQIPELREDEEPLVVSDDEIAVADIVEDELLLLLPMVPMHPESECPAPPVETNAATDAEEDSEERADNPFAQLAAIKKELI